MEAGGRPVVIYCSPGLGVVLFCVLGDVGGGIDRTFCMCGRSQEMQGLGLHRGQLHKEAVLHSSAG
jgi:hypothetical protein